MSFDFKDDLVVFQSKVIFLQCGYLYSLRSKGNINDLKSIGPCAFHRVMSYEHLKLDLDRVQTNMLK